MLISFLFIIYFLIFNIYYLLVLSAFMRSLFIDYLYYIYCQSIYNFNFPIFTLLIGSFFY